MSHVYCSTLAFGLPMGAEWLVIGMLGLLIFGKRLPEVAKGIGGAVSSFKKGLRDVENEVDTAVDQPGTAERRLPDQTPAVGSKPAPKFDPYTGKPLEEATVSA